MAQCEAESAKRPYFCCSLGDRGRRRMCEAQVRCRGQNRRPLFSSSSASPKIVRRHQALPTFGDLPRRQTARRPLGQSHTRPAPASGTKPSGFSVATIHVPSFGARELRTHQLQNTQHCYHLGQKKKKKHQTSLQGRFAITRLMADIGETFHPK